MADEIRQEVRELLEDEKNFSTRAGLRLVLTMLMEIDSASKEQVKAGRELERRVSALEKKNIIMWLGEHKYLTALYSILLFLAANAWFVSGIRKPMLVYFFKHVFGVDIPIEAIP
jgi:hypothetical protein